MESVYHQSDTVRPVHVLPPSDGRLLVARPQQMVIRPNRYSTVPAINQLMSLNDSTDG